MEEELDLDSFLDSQSVGDGDANSDDDDDGDRPPSIPHRTVDEILLLHDFSSSSSSSPPSSPSPPSASASSTTAAASRNNLNHNHSLDYSSARLRSFDSALLHSSSSALPDSPSPSSSVVVVLPPLFTAVKSNVKPGAALAAAAAASRSIPTPHATAIKSSRAATSSTAAAAAAAPPPLLPVPNSNSTPSNVLSPDSNSTPSNVLSPDSNSMPYTRRGGGRLEQEADGGGQFSVSAARRLDARIQQQDLIDQAAEAFPTEHPPTENDDDASAGEGTVSSIPFDSPAKHDLDSDDNSTAASLASVDSQGKQFQPPSPSSSSSHSEEDDSNEVPSFHSTNMIVQEDMMTPIVPHSYSQKDVIFQPKDDVLSLSSEDEVADIVQDAAWRLKNSKHSRKTNKKSHLVSLSPLQVAEELEKKQAFTGMHWEEGAAAQPMRLEGVRKASTVLGYFDVDSNNSITRIISSQSFRREHGYPLVLSVHLNYIAIGMSKGVIVVVPSKYSPYHSDNMDAKILMLGLQGDRSYVPVTSMCFNQLGDFLFAGYSDGQFCFWDVQRASALKVITEHKAPIVHMLFVGQDSQVSKQVYVVSGDSKGIVKLIRFSFFPLVNKISYYKAATLCDEKMGVVICASVLISGECLVGAMLASQGNNLGTTSAIGSMMGVIGGDTGSKYSSAGEDGVFIFVFHQNALVGKLVPSAESVVKYACIPKPDGVGEGSMPYASWRCISDSNASSAETVRAETSEKVPFLAIAWDRKVQVAKLVKSELKEYGKWTLDSPAVGVAWLDDQMLVVLTSVGQLGLFTKDGNMIHQTSFAVDGSRGDDMITYHTYFNNSYGNPENAYHNCVAVRGASIYVLGPSHLVVSRLLPWKERIEVLRRAGDWMGSLNMAMTLYDGQAHGVIDLPRTLDDVQKTIMPYLAQLLLAYVDEVFSYIKVASGNQVGNSDQLDELKSSSCSDHPEIKEQYIRVGGVAVEFCVHINRTDILFDEIYSRFDAAQHKETFLELLEPYILKDMLGCLPPAVMQALVEHYSTKGWLQRVEQCVLHMDISSLDFNQVVRLCREHSLHGALIYLFNKGLDDFRTPLEELLGVVQNCKRGSASALGYRMLVYLKYCFQGLAFPPGHGTLPTTRLLSVKEEILQFLLDSSSIPNAWAVMNLPSHGRFPNLCHLLELDTEATLNVLRIAFVEGKIPDPNHLYEGLVNENVESTEVNNLWPGSQNLVQKLVDVLSLVLEASNFQNGCSTGSNDGSSMETWPSKKDAGHVIEFITYYVACERAKVSRDTLSHVLEYLTSDFSLIPSDSEQNIETAKAREKQLLTLLNVVPDTDWDAQSLLHLCERCQFHQVCGFIHSSRYHYLAALDSYMKAADEPIHAFSFIHDMLLQLREKEYDAFRAAVFSRIADLVKLSREGTFFLVVYHFYGQSQQILFPELKSHSETLFLYMKTLIEVQTTGNLKFSCFRKDGSVCCSNERRARHQSDRVKTYLEALSDFPKLLRNSPIQLTDEMTELYFELLCRYERESVRKFLETFESYRVESCLRLCQEYGIVDAAAFLLERVDEVGSALVLILSGLNEKFIMLDASIESGQSESVSMHFNTVLKKKEVKDILDDLRSCIGLCQRNSPRLGPDESEYLWFQLLDSAVYLTEAVIEVEVSRLLSGRFCLPLMDSCSSKAGSAHALIKQEDEELCKINWKFSKSHINSHILRKLLSVFIREIVEGMIGYVSISTIMLKLLSDNGSQQFGDFKPTILGMLGTYDFERRILDTAKSLIEDDTYYTMSLLKKGACHGYAPQDLTCCICNCSLMKNSHSSSIQVFSCGHALHVHCALQENETPIVIASAGCPICVAGKKVQRSSKSVLVDNGLVRKASSTLHEVPGTIALHPQDNDAFENTYGYHPISRFELLNSLDKDQRATQIETMPQLRLAPPVVYHEKVKKGIGIVTEESSTGSFKAEKSSSSREFRDIKVKGSSVRFPLRSNIFGKEKRSKRSN